MAKSTGAARVIQTTRLIGDTFLRSSLWIIEGALMLASNGIDGTYLAALMPWWLGWTGYVLNISIDATTAILMYFYGILQKDRSETKRKRARWLLLAEVFAILASWFISWRQLRIVMPAIEPEDWRVVAFITAAIVPGFLGFIGYCQALLARPVELPKTTAEPAEVPAPERQDPTLPSLAPAEPAGPQRRTATIGDWNTLSAGLDGQRATITAGEIGTILEGHGLAAPAARTLRAWAERTRNEEG